MDDIRQYILSVIAAALICGIVNVLITMKSAYGAVVKLISGLFLTVAIIAPITNFQLPDPESYLDGLSHEADTIVSSGQLMAEKEQANIIKKNIEALIREKAVSVNVDITSDVTLEEETFIPVKVKLSGTVSPYSKQILARYIQETLGIAEEDQIWM